MGGPYWLKEWGRGKCSAESWVVWDLLFAMPRVRRHGAGGGLAVIIAKGSFGGGKAA